MYPLRFLIHLEKLTGLRKVLHSRLPVYCEGHKPEAATQGAAWEGPGCNLCDLTVCPSPFGRPDVIPRQRAHLSFAGWNCSWGFATQGRWTRQRSGEEAEVCGLSLSHREPVRKCQGEGRGSCLWLLCAPLPCWGWGCSRACQGNPYASWGGSSHLRTCISFC